MRVSLWITDLFWVFKSKHKNDKIAAFPYVSENHPGGDIRIGNWKEPLKNKGIEFEVFWASDKNEYDEYLQEGLTLKNYILHFKILFRRLKLLNKAKRYKVVWVQRNYIPFYPLKRPFFEERLAKSGVLLVVDYYDADYAHNVDLVNETAALASRISVSSPFLLNYFAKINCETYFLPLTLKSSNYLKKDYKKEESKLIIGWMGSPENSIELERIGNLLKVIECKYLNISFEFVCRKKIDLPLKRIVMRNWNDDGFDYYKWLVNVDIGIVPILANDDMSLAKSPMKLLEFLCSGIATVSSSCEAYSELIGGEHCLFAKSDENWIEHLSFLIESLIERKRLGDNGLAYFKDNHSYENNAQTLLNIFDVTY